MTTMFDGKVHSSLTLKASLDEEDMAKVAKLVEQNAKAAMLLREIMQWPCIDKIDAGRCVLDAEAWLSAHDGIGDG